MTLGAETIPVISSIEALGVGYAAWLVDIWGVMHDGVRAYAPAVVATRRFRERGGIVVLLSNSPRPDESLKGQLDRLGVTRDCYDATVSSGDLTRHELSKHKGARVFHLGPERDRPIFDGLEVSLVGPEDPELVVCTGLFDDEVETPEDYDSLLRDLAARKVLMFCANPDRMVQRGDVLIFCAGALAEVYGELGGAVIYAGKPYAPIYELAFERIAEAAGKAVPKDGILVIGDGVHTDLAGAASFGLDAVFVASGLHMAKTKGHDTLEDLFLAELFEGIAPPVAAMPELAW